MASRRTLDASIASIFLAYVFFRSAACVPNVIQWSGASLQKAMSHIWITTERAT